MKNILIFILAAVAFSGCSASKPILVGKNHQVVFGNPRVKAQKEGRKLIEPGAAEFSASIQH
jgi:uncharacterized protein YcfL